MRDFMYKNNHFINILKEITQFYEHEHIFKKEKNLDYFHWRYLFMHLEIISIEF